MAAKVHLYYWIVVYAVEPNLEREVVFKHYPFGAQRWQQTRKMLGLIGQIVNRANFTPEPLDSSGHNSFHEKELVR
jgi:hypothetical protein